MVKVVGGTVVLLALAYAGAARAYDIPGVQSAAVDQPRVNVQLRREPTGVPLQDEFLSDLFGFPITNFSAYFDTGASGVVLSESTAASFGVNTAPGVTFSDFAIGGATTFQVSEPLYLDVGPFSFALDPFANPFLDPAYPQKQFGAIRAQVGPLNFAVDPLLEDLGIALGSPDVLGVPTMAGSVVVMDGRPLNAFDPLGAIFGLESMRTYVYGHGTPFNPGSDDSDPGIPPTNRTVALSVASFDRFTKIDPDGAEGPTTGGNPFIGPNPLAPAGDPTPGVTLEFGSAQTTGSFLLDTGAAASIISTALAGQLGIAYDGAGNLVDSGGTLLPGQYHLTLGGLGGSAPAAGFFLDSLLVPTKEGDPLRFTQAPVLVADITLVNPDDDQDTFTLDGIFGMNFLVASVPFSDEFIAACGIDLFCLLDLFGSLSPSAFDWIVFDHDNRELGLNVAALAAPDGSVPEPASLALVLLGLLIAAWRSRPSRCRAAD